MTGNVNKINKIVIAFLKENTNDQKNEELWMSNDIQKQVKSFCISTSNGHKKKDPNAPKRGKSAYLFFCSDNREKVKSKLGKDAKATDITRELGIRWNALKISSKSADKKSLSGYEKEAEHDRNRYEQEKESYVPPVQSFTPKRRVKKEQNVPKRAKSAYLYFCTDKRDEVKASDPSLKATEITSRLGEMWNKLKSDKNRVDELVVYEKMANDDKSRYELEKSENKKSVTTRKDSNDSELVDESEKNKPSVKSQNGYQLFCTEKRAEMKESKPNAKASEITKKLSVAWKALNKDEQNKWKNTVVTK